MKAADLLSESGIEATVLRLTKLTDLSANDILTAMPANRHIIVVGAEISSIMGDCKVSIIDLGDQYVSHGAVNILYEHYGLSSEAIKNYVMEVHRDEN